MRRFLVRSLFYALVLLVIANVLAFMASYSLKHSAFYKSTFLTHNFEKGEQFDYIVLGSSRGLTTLDTKQIDSTLNTKGVNLSMDDTDLKSQLLMLRHFYASGYSAKVVVLALDRNNFNKVNDKLGNNDYRFAPFAGRDYVHEHYSRYEQGLVKPLAHSQYLPFLSFSYYNLELAIPSLATALNPNRRNRFDERGNYTYPVRKVSGDEDRKDETHEATIDNPMLEEIIRLADEHDSKKVFYIAPYQFDGYTLQTTLEDVTILNHSDKLDADSLFFDYHHVNSNGRKVATDLFIDGLKEVL